MYVRKYSSIFALTLLIGCTATGQRTSINVDYYDVKGTTFKQLDQQIALHGPTVPGVGKAVASTNIRMLPDIRFKESTNGCEIDRVNIKVIAKVILPKLRDRSKASQSLRPAFSNIERYAREHEAVHVKIADEHAEKAENAIRQLLPESSCAILRSKADASFKSVMTEHQAAQLKFDADEKLRFASIKQKQS